MKVTGHCTISPSPKTGALFVAVRDRILIVFQIKLFSKARLYLSHAFEKANVIEGGLSTC